MRSPYSAGSLKKETFYDSLGQQYHDSFEKEVPMTNELPRSREPSIVSYCHMSAWKPQRRLGRFTRASSRASFVIPSALLVPSTFYDIATISPMTYPASRDRMKRPSSAPSRTRLL